MKKKFLILITLAIFLIVLFSLMLVEIPSPSKIVSENYQLEVE